VNSIGNDVVALAGINPERTRQHRFCSKIISSAEQDAYPALQIYSFPFEHYVWLLWSVKESAYKFVKRLQPGLIFSPTKVIVQKLSHPAMGNYCGTVNCNGLVLRFRSEVTNTYIHTIVSYNAEFKHVHFGVAWIAQSDYAFQFAAVRQSALYALSNLLPNTAITIRKHHTGYPEVWIGNEALPMPLSFSHDGNYVAYACLKTNETSG
jgi:phosphopantetheinyl transferase (holo-ACP synthase)